MRVGETEPDRTRSNENPAGQPRARRDHGNRLRVTISRKLRQDTTCVISGSNPKKKNLSSLQSHSKQPDKIFISVGTFTTTKRGGSSGYPAPCAVCSRTKASASVKRHRHEPTTRAPQGRLKHIIGWRSISRTTTEFLTRPMGTFRPRSPTAY